MKLLSRHLFLQVFLLVACKLTFVQEHRRDLQDILPFMQVDVSIGKTKAKLELNSKSKKRNKPIQRKYRKQNAFTLAIARSASREESTKLDYLLRRITNLPASSKCIV